MSDGATHHYYWTKWAYVVLPVSILASFVFLISEIKIASIPLWQLFLFVGFGYYLGNWIDPDLDQISITSAEGRMMRSAGLLGFVFVGYWVVYAGVMLLLVRILGISNPRMGAHRSAITHTVFPGTAIRILWLNIPAIVLWSYLSNKYGWTLIQPVFTPYFIGLFSGMAISDTIHYSLDQRSSYVRNPTRAGSTRTRYGNNRTKRTRANRRL